MSATNLAITNAPNLLRCKDEIKGVSDMTAINRLIAFTIEHFAEVFPVTLEVPEEQVIFNIFYGI